MDATLSALALFSAAMSALFVIVILTALALVVLALPVYLLRRLFGGR